MNFLGKENEGLNSPSRSPPTFGFNIIVPTHCPPPGPVPILCSTPSSLNAPTPLGPANAFVFTPFGLNAPALGPTPSRLPRSPFDLNAPALGPTPSRPRSPIGLNAPAFGPTPSRLPRSPCPRRSPKGTTTLTQKNLLPSINITGRKSPHTPVNQTKPSRRFLRSPRPENFDSFGFLKESGQEEEEHVPESYVRPEEDKLTLWTQILQEWDQWQDGRLQYLVICEGLPTKKRVEIWKKFLCVDKFMEKDPDLYETLLNLPEQLECSEQIRLDIRRTFGTHKLFRTDEGRKQLFNVLKAYSLYDTEVGYCQGMSYVGATLLMNMTEKEAFWVLVALMGHIQSNYLPSMAGILEGSESFMKLLKIFNPTIYEHLEKVQIQTLIFISRWFLTLFTDLGNWRTILRLWDVIFYEGRLALQRISLAIVSCCEKHLLSYKKIEEIIPFLLNLPKDILQPKVLLPAVFRVDIQQLMENLQVPTIVTDDSMAMSLVDPMSMVTSMPMSPMVASPEVKNGTSVFTFVNQLWAQFADTPVPKRVIEEKTQRGKRLSKGLSFNFMRKSKNVPVEDFTTPVIERKNLQTSFPTPFLPTPLSSTCKRKSDETDTKSHQPVKKLKF